MRSAAGCSRANPALDGTTGDGLPRLPVFLRFDRHRVVVVGGGAVAAAKIPALLAAGGNVTVIAPRVSAAIDRARVTVDRARVPARRSRRRMVRHRGRDAGGQSPGSRSGRSARRVRERGGRSRERDRLSRRHDRARRRDRGVFDRGPGAGAGRACCVKRSTSSCPPISANGSSAPRRSRGSNARRECRCTRAAPAAARCAQSALRRPRSRRPAPSLMSGAASSRSSAPGPGDPDHLTQKAVRRLRDADVVLHDALVSAEVCALAVNALAHQRRQARRARSDAAARDRAADD